MSADLANFYNQTRDARKVIIVDLGFLGDTVHLLPALHELKRNYSGARLHVLTSPIGCEVLGLASCVDRAWAIEMAPHKRSLRQQWQVLRALRQERFDLAFNFSGADQTIFMTALAGARLRVAHRGGRSHFWSRWLVSDWILFIQPTDPVFERRRETLLSRCSLHVGADSGVLHLARALELPTISLFRNYPNLPAWLPRGSHYRSFTANCACFGQKKSALLEAAPGRLPEGNSSRRCRASCA